MLLWAVFYWRTLWMSLLTWQLTTANHKWSRDMSQQRAEVFNTSRNILCLHFLDLWPLSYKISTSVTSVLHSFMNDAVDNKFGSLCVSVCWVWRPHWTDGQTDRRADKTRNAACYDGRIITEDKWNRVSSPKGRLFQAQVRVNHEVNSGNFPS